MSNACRSCVNSANDAWDKVTDFHPPVFITRQDLEWLKGLVAELEEDGAL